MNATYNGMVPANTKQCNSCALQTFMPVGQNKRVSCNHVPSDILTCHDATVVCKYMLYFLREVWRRDGEPYPPGMEWTWFLQLLSLLILYTWTQRLPVFFLFFVCDWVLHELAHFGFMWFPSSSIRTYIALCSLVWNYGTVGAFDLPTHTTTNSLTVRFVMPNTVDWKCCVGSILLWWIFKAQSSFCIPLSPLPNGCSQSSLQIWYPLTHYSFPKVSIFWQLSSHMHVFLVPRRGSN